MVMSDTEAGGVGWPAYGTCPDTGLQTVAFLEGDDKLVVVVMNCADAATEFQMGYQGDAHCVCRVVENHLLGNYFNNMAPAHSIQTYMLPI